MTGADLEMMTITVDLLWLHGGPTGEVSPFRQP